MAKVVRQAWHRGTNLVRGDRINASGAGVMIDATAAAATTPLTEFDVNDHGGNSHHGQREQDPVDHP